MTNQTTYTEISFWRNGVVSQRVELDLETYPRHAADKLRVWIERMARIELDANYTVKIRPA